MSWVFRQTFRQLKMHSPESNNLRRTRRMHLDFVSRKRSSELDIRSQFDLTRSTIRRIRVRVERPTGD